MNILKIITESWEVLVAVASAIGGVVGWFRMQKKKKGESTQMLFDQMEVLKKKVILQVSKEVEQSTTIAQKNRIIEGLKTQCPECYEAFMKTIPE